MVIKKYMKITRFCLLVLLILGLSACRREKGIVFGDLNEQTTYLQVGNYRISERELYERMLMQREGNSFTVIDTFIEEIERIFLRREIQTVIDQWDETFRERAIERTRQAVYGTDDLEQINRMNATIRRRQERQFLDSMAIRGILADYIFAENILVLNQLEFAKEVFARNVLTRSSAIEKIEDADGNEIDNPDYISEADIERHFDANFKGRGDFSAIIIRFTNLAEADRSMENIIIDLTPYGGRRYHGARSFRGELYLVPDNIPFNQIITADNVHLYTNFNSIDDGRAMLITYLRIYHHLFSFNVQFTEADINQLENLSFEEIIAILTDEANEKFHVFQHDYDDLLDWNFQLTTWISNNLRVYNEEYAIERPRFTATPISINNTFFLVYKLADGVDPELDDELKAYIRNEIIEERLTSSFIASRLSNAMFDLLTLEIYDGFIELLYSNIDGNYDRTRRTSTNNVAKIIVRDEGDLNDEHTMMPFEAYLSVRDLFNVLEARMGYHIAKIAVSSQILLGRQDVRNLITSEDREAFQEDFDLTMNNFRDNHFAHMGLPSSLNRRQFIRKYFAGARNEREVMEYHYTLEKMVEIFTSDFRFFFPVIRDGNNVSVYEIFQQYAQLLFENHYNLGVSHLLVYLDLDDSGSPDNVAKVLTEEELAFYEEIVFELLLHIQDLATNVFEANYVDSLRFIADEYNRANKFNTTCFRYIDRDNNICEPGRTYGDLRRKGIHLRFENLSTINNSSAWNFDEVFIAQLEKMNENLPDPFPEQYVQRFETKDDLTLSSFGWHMLVITSATDIENTASARFLETNDHAGAFRNLRYTDYDGTEVILNAYSDHHWLSVNQVEIFLREMNRTNGVENLPARVKTAANLFLGPVISKFNSTETRLFLMATLIEGYQFMGTNADRNAELLLTSMEVAVRRSNDYRTYTNPSINPLHTWFYDLFDFRVRGA
ncbi:MAG: hypothetical protein FWE36_03705 [Erysipelotrichales bacterium]|nr:hypothetical protein [Erysipelotrichales bacterium]